MSGTAVWITGLPGSGKSTLSDKLKVLHPDFIVLRMDELRKVVTPEPEYSEQEREIVYRSLVFIASKLTELGHDVVIDATGNLRKWRDLARKLIPNYIEVYLKCPVAVCASRELLRPDTRGAPKDIYKKGNEGWPVPGLTAPYEEPLAPEITIAAECTPPDEAVSIIYDYIRSGL